MITVRVCETLSCRMAGGERCAPSSSALRRRRSRVGRPHRPLRGRAGGCRRPQPDRRATVAAVERAIAAGATGAALPAYIDYAKYRADGGYAHVRASASTARGPSTR